MGLRAGEGELKMQGHIQPCKRVRMMVPTQVFRVGVWHAKLLSVQSVCCWNKIVITLLVRAQSKMGMVWLRLQSTWISWDTGAFQSMHSPSSGLW